MLSFAYGRDAPLVDTNVRRVLGRVFLGPRRLRRLRGDRAIWGSGGGDPAPGPGVRLQSGADGLRRHVVHAARAALFPLPDAELLCQLSAGHAIVSVASTPAFGCAMSAGPGALHEIGLACPP